MNGKGTFKPFPIHKGLPNRSWCWGGSKHVRIPTKSMFKNLWSDSYSWQTNKKTVQCNHALDDR